MLKELKFVKGSVATKGIVQELQHFKIEEGRVCGYNGLIALSTPLDFDINCIPKADSLVKAIDKCKDVIKLSMTPAGKLRIQSGKARFLVECIEETQAHVEPEGDIYNIDGTHLLEAMKVLFPFVANDAAKPWSNGILFKGESAFATNNVIFLEKWLGVTIPREINVPSAAIREIIRINEAPIKIQLCENNISFHYEDGRWLRSQLLTNQWPDTEGLLNIECTPSPLPEGFFEALDDVKPFADKAIPRVIFENNLIKTHDDHENTGASVELEGVDFGGAYVLEMVQKLESVVQTIDMNHYPRPCPFYGDNLRGVIIGLKLHAV